MPGPIVNPRTGQNSACIDVRFAHSGLNADLKLGAAPLVSINRDFLQDGAGTIIGVNTKINLSGQIRPSGTQLGFTELLKREKRLRDLFSYGAGDFEIIKEGSVIFSGINAKVLSYSTEKSDNNWVMSMGYSVDLEFYESVRAPGEGNPEYRVTSISEGWSIEPLEDYIYTIIQTPASDPDPDSNGGQSQIEGVPQFRVTRKLSAVGVPKNGFYSHFDKNRNNDSEYNFRNTTQKPSDDAYLQAKKWVDDRLKLPFNKTDNTDGRYTVLLSNSDASSGSMFSTFSDLYLYNHTRNINYSITDGSYEVSDSWLALNKAAKFTEDFTIETSTDNKNIRTVKVQGTINGLQITQGNLYMEKDSLKVPYSGDGNIYLSGYNVGGETYNDIMPEKYNNAFSGWIYDVKPALYKRACLAINSRDRTQPWYPSTPGLLPPGNPVFRTENVLNYIPISTSENHDLFNGTVSYTYEYNNIVKIISGVISESYRINTTGPTDSVAELFVLNRPLGPVLQSLGTKTSTTKKIEVELVLVPPTSIAGFSLDDPSCPVGIGTYVFNKCEEFIDAQQPTEESGNGMIVSVKSDTYSWSPTDGRYTRNKEWLYQPCYKDGHPYQFMR
jgi:hypothetical protein